MRTKIVVAAIAVLSCVPAGTATAADPAKKALSFDVVTGPNDDVPCTIQADLYTPDGASKASPVPAIMATNGFGGSKNDFASLGMAYARRGYAFLAYSGLGFGNSGCKITLDDPDWDGKAGSQLVSFLGGSKAAKDGTKVDFVVKDAVDHAGAKRDDDPRVGMIGGSYGGQIQFAIASVDPRMDAIVPQITWHDLSYALTGNNTDFTSGVASSTPGVAKLDWPLLFTALGTAQGFQQAIQNQDPSHLGACPNFADQVCPGLVTSAAFGYPDAATKALLQHASVGTYMAKIRIPTLLSQGLNDTLFNVQEAVATWQALRAQNTPVKMLWRSSGHSGGGIPGESNSTDLEKAYESRMALEWFDFYLRGLGDAPALDVSFLRNWVKYEGDAAPAVGVTPSYPVGSSRKLFLSGSDALVESVGKVAAGAAQFAVTAVVTGDGGASAVPLPALGDIPGGFAAFRTEPFGEDVEVAGVPVLDVRLDAPAHAATQSDALGKLILVARVQDVAPDGTRTTPFKITSSVRVGDVTKPVRIELPGIVHRFAKGHRLEVVLSQGAATRAFNRVPGPVSVLTDPASPSTLTVPVLGAQAAATGSGPGGSTPYVASPEAGPAQPAGLGAPPKTKGAAKLPSRRKCASRRSFRIRLARAPRGDRIRSAVVTVNGKRVKTLRGKRLRATVVLRGLPKGTARVVVTLRTVKGKTLRSARTYRTCAARRK